MKYYQVKGRDDLYNELDVTEWERRIVARWRLKEYSELHKKKMAKQKNKEIITVAVMLAVLAAWIYLPNLLA